METPANGHRNVGLAEKLFKTVKRGLACIKKGGRKDEIRNKHVKKILLLRAHIGLKTNTPHWVKN